MNWNITPQHLASVMTMFLLFIRMDKDCGPVSKGQIDKQLGAKGIGPKRTAIALGELEHRGLAQRVATDTEERFEITSRGVHWIEDSFEFRRGESYTFSPKHKRVIIGKLQSELKSSDVDSAVHVESVNWGKWGAIAGIIALPVAIVVAWYFR